MDLEGLATLVLDPRIPPEAILALVFASCILESFFPPWPTDVIALYAGLLAGRGHLAPSLVFLAAIAGTQVGVMSAFWIARHWGRAILTGRMARYVPIERLVQLEGWFARYGAPAIAISRFLPGIRALVMPAAGLARFPAWKVMLWAGASVVVWNVFVVGLGFMAGTHLDWARQILVQYQVVAGGVLGVALVGAVCALLRRRRARSPAREP